MFQRGQEQFVKCWTDVGGFGQQAHQELDIFQIEAAIAVNVFPNQKTISTRMSLKWTLFLRALVRFQKQAA